MKCWIAMVLLGVCWQMPAPCHADDKADPVNLQSELELLRKQVAKLKADLNQVERERDQLRAELHKQTNSQAKT
jgi:septal ring factor EnvC (AmiA/AmiB activator)